MSESGAAVASVDAGVEEEDCPLCLEPLPPFWDTSRLVVYDCCGKRMCLACKNKRDAYLNRAIDEGSYGKEEQQLASTCPLCRAQRPIAGGHYGRELIGIFEESQLPLHLYFCLGLHFVRGTGGVERNVERGNEILMLGAEKGDPNCQYLVAAGYQGGIHGFPKSITEAKRWWLAAAEQGHAIAEFYLARMFRDEGNDAEYLRYLRRSASKGYDDACCTLGLVYYKGDYGVQKSTEEAIRVVTPAAKRGDAKSMSLLGLSMMYQHDTPAPTDPNFTKGMHWLRKAAEKGSVSAISTLKEIEEKASSKCFMCEKEAPPEIAFLRCSRCRAAWYCSKDCQVQHWKAEEGGHKHFCIKWK